MRPAASCHLSSSCPLPFLLLTVSLLCLSTLPLSLSQIVPYKSAPVIWHTFDVQPAASVTVNWSWALGSFPHTGQALLNGDRQYIDLLRVPDDYGNVFPITLPLTLTLEYWLQWRDLNWWSRVFECGQGRRMDNINLSNMDDTRDLALGIDSGDDHTRTVGYEVINRGTWQHVVVTLAQQTYSNTRTGTLAIYVDGQLVNYRNDSFLLKPVRRPHCWIGKSEYAKEEGGDDGWFSGSIDDFFYYDYPLSAEAVLAHYVLPRPPVYELTFSSDPRVIVPAPSYTYSWSDVDIGDGNNITKFHNGHLVLRGDSYIDLMTSSGGSAIGAALPPVLMGPSGANGTLPAGWSIEVLVKALTLQPSAKIFDFGSGAGPDNVILGYDNDVSRIRFSWYVNNVLQTPLAVVNTATANSWMHIVITLAPAAGTPQRGTVTAYFNGRLAGQSSNVQLPADVRRSHAYIGRSNWADQSFDCYLDAFRLYDYELSAAEVRDLQAATTEQVQLPTDFTTDTNPVYHTAPAASFSFRTPKPSGEWGSYTAVEQNSSHYGLAAFNGRTDYVDLTQYRDDLGAVMPLRMGGSMCFEVWVRWDALNTFSRVFDFGAVLGSNQNTIMLANIREDADLLFETLSGDAAYPGRVIATDGIQVGQWQHIVASVQQVSASDSTSSTAGVFKLYLNGVLAGSQLGYLPYTFTHRSSWLGRSNFEQDALFAGELDAFYYYDYALQYEQVAAHFLLPLPPVFELAFTYDPRPFLNSSMSYTYRWEEFDPAEQQLADSPYHNGYLLLEADSWVNLTATSGPATVGTVLPTILFAPPQGSGNLIRPLSAQNRGWSLELLVKLETQENSTNIFDFGNGPNQDNVLLGYSGLERQLVFQIIRNNSAENTYWPVIGNTVLNRWYHIVIVLRQQQVSGERCAVQAFVDGEAGTTLPQRFMPRGVPRRNAFLGRSNVPGDGFFDMKLDTFRIYDYALSSSLIQQLYALTTAELPDVSLPLYNTAPTAQYTFDVAPGNGSVSDGISSYQWLAYDPASSSHLGIAHFNGVDQWVNLMTFPDDAGSPFPAVFGNRSLSFEAWVKYEALHWYSRVFDFGNGAAGDNIMMSNVGDTARLAVHVYVGTTGNSSIMDSSNSLWQVGQWQHVVLTIEDQTFTNSSAVTQGRNGPNAALYTVYLQGRIVNMQRGYLPHAVQRTESFLAKSHWVQDGLFEGMLDSFYYYDYALSAEQVNMHIVVPRPPVFDLSFSNDPRLLLPMNPELYSYGWQDYDPLDSLTNRTRFHSGHLLLEARAQNWVNLSTAAGDATLGVVLPRIGGRVQPISGTSAGWSLEVIAKISTRGVYAKLLDWGNGPDGDNIIIGYQGDSNVLTFQVFNNLLGVGSSKTVVLVNDVVYEQWYHLLVVLQPEGLRGWQASYSVYVDGQFMSVTSDVYLPQNIQRRSALLGRSNWEADAYFSGKIDAIRVYDYALTQAQATALYRLAHDPTFSPLPSSTAGPRPPPVSTAGRTAPYRPSSSSSSSVPVCEYNGVWPDRCECRCGPGYYPNCTPCPGEETSEPKQGSALSAAAVIGIVLVLLLLLATLIIGCIWWKNRRGRVTYSLDGGWSDSGGTGSSSGGDSDGWLGAGGSKRKAKQDGLLGDAGGSFEDSSSTYDWQSYRNTGSSGGDGGGLGRNDIGRWS